MRFLVDGYNVTKRDPSLSAMPLAGQREALATRLAVRGSDLLGGGPIVVVYDGVSGGGSDTRHGAVEVRYSRDEPADDLIERLTGAGDTVVTSDGELATRVRGKGAAVLAAEVCFERPGARRRRGRFPASTAGLPRGANEITRELKELWLDDGE